MIKVLVPLAVNLANEAHQVRYAYTRHLIKYGLTPLLVTPDFTQSMLDSCYSQCQGILLLGGSDVNAQCYGEENHVLNDYKKEPGRDELELPLAKRAIQDRKPILAICRGSQVLVVAGGGTLHQHLPDLGLAEDHKPKDPNSDPFGFMHTANIIRDSKAYQLIKKESVQVNSHHHQAFKSVGKDFRISGLSPLGIAELVEHTDPNYFCYGIQSHPETFESSDLEVFFEMFAKELQSKMN